MLHPSEWFPLYELQKADATISIQSLELLQVSMPFLFKDTPDITKQVITTYNNVVYRKDTVGIFKVQVDEIEEYLVGSKKQKTQFDLVVDSLNPSTGLHIYVGT